MAAVPLDRLHQDGRGSPADAAPDRVPQQVGVMDGEIIVRHAGGSPVRVRLGHADELRHQPMELIVCVRPACGHRGQRSAVVAVVEREGIGRARPVLGRDLQRHLDGEAAVEAVADPVEPMRRELGDPIREEQERNGVVVAPRVGDLLGLGRGRGEDLGMAGADVVRPRLGRAVDVLVAVGVPDSRALGPDEEQVRLTRDGRRPASQECLPPAIESALVELRCLCDHGSSF